MDGVQMDFSITEDQQSLQNLAQQILTERATHDHLKELERQSWSVFDRDLWQQLAGAGIAGMALPESAGGAGLGFVELGLVLGQVGRAGAPGPGAPTRVPASGPGEDGGG